jgi:nitrogen regulatory protein PII
MAKLIALIINDPDRLEDVVYDWVDAGVRGLTIVDSTGWTQRVGGRSPRRDRTLLDALQDIVFGRERNNRLLFSIVEEEFDVDELIERTETQLGPLDESGVGILFVIPVDRVAGLT